MPTTIDDINATHKLRQALDKEGLLYAVYLQDTNGHRRLVGNQIDVNEKTADEYMRNIEARHSKSHKVDYFKVGYTPQTKAAILKENNIEI